MTTNYCYHENHICKLLLVGQNGVLQRIYFVTKQATIKPQTHWVKKIDAFKDVCKQLDLYFHNKLKKFTVQLSIQGTIFEQQVWQALQKIPYGKTKSYGDLAKNLNNPNAARAVGNAANKNPLPIIIPCHRLLGSKGNLVGFAGGLPLKRTLLQLEGLDI